MGTFGQSNYSQEILDSLAGRNVQCIDINPDGLSNLKTRVLDSTQQLVRIDRESTNISAYSYLLQHPELIKDSSLVILSDYNKGTLSESSDIISLANQYQKKVFVDPKQSNLSSYKGAYCITPNLREYSSYCLLDSEINLLQKWDIQDFCSSATAIQLKYQIENIFCTRSSDGYSLFTDLQEYHEDKTHVQRVFDVTGAGDTFMAALAAEFVSSGSLESAGRFANQAASISVQHSGTYPVSFLEVASSDHHPIKTPFIRDALVPYPKY